MSKHKPPSPPAFMVFGESVPLAGIIADPTTPTHEREEALESVSKALDTVANVEARNTQQKRHEANNARRDAVLRDLGRDAAGHPLRGEPARLARVHSVPLRTVRGWIEDTRKPTKPIGAKPNSWMDVYYGEGLQHHYGKLATNEPLAAFIEAWRCDPRRRDRTAFAKDEHEAAGLKFESARAALQGINRDG